MQPIDAWVRVEEKEAGRRRSNEKEPEKKNPEWKKVQIKRVSALESVMIGEWRQLKGKKRHSRKITSAEQKRQMNWIHFEVCWRRVGVHTFTNLKPDALLVLLYNSKEMHFVVCSSTWYSLLLRQVWLTWKLIARSRFADLKIEYLRNRLWIDFFLSAFFSCISCCLCGVCTQNELNWSNGICMAMAKVDGFWHVDGIKGDEKWRMKRKKHKTENTTATHMTNGMNLSTLV